MMAATPFLPTDAFGQGRLRLWALPFLTVSLIIVNLQFGQLDSPAWVSVAALCIAVFGIPHGTLDVEIAAARLGRSSPSIKLKIVGAYLLCAGLMTSLWFQVPELALSLFLIVSIVHFSQDWQGKADPFLALMVAWALVALPALTKPVEVAEIFDMLVGNRNGAVIAALLACASAPALLGCFVYAKGSYHSADPQVTVEVISCLIAAIFLPPLIAFSIFFCGLHSPRHMRDAMRETGAISARQKGGIIAAVFMLSAGFGIVLLIGQDQAKIDVGIIRSVFMLISILTMPHFILEHVRPVSPRAG